MVEIESSILYDRVAEYTDPEINEEIVKDIENSLSFYAKNKDLIDERIKILNSEWDIERVLETNASIFALGGLLAGIITKKRNFFILPTVVLTFLLQHALLGWCPPVPIFRSMKIRTKEEILVEIIGLRIIKGDFDDISEISKESPCVMAEQIIEKLKQ